MKYNKENPLRVTTLFSGYDSQCLSLDSLKDSIPGFDYELVNWCEIDAFAIKAHNALYPQWADRNLGDISKVDWSKANPCDCLTYSFPCTNISNAGQQAGFEKGSGTASSLLWECEKAIRILRPKYLLMENVKALMSQKFMPLFNEWRNLIYELGYESFTKILNATQFNVPQNRERVFMVSILREDENDVPSFRFPQPIPLELRLKDILEEEVDDKYVLSETAIQGFLKHNENHKAKGTGFLWIPKDVETTGGQIANCLSARQFKCGATDNYIKEFRGGESIANCLRGTGALCPTDNTIREIRCCELSEGEGIPECD